MPQITIKLPHKDSITIIANLFNIYSNTQIDILKAILSQAQSLQLTLTPHIRNQIQRDIMLSSNTFAQGLMRLKKAKLITQKGKIITFHPIFKDIETADGLRILFK